jgi:hypothetical protein
MLMTAYQKEKEEKENLLVKLRSELEKNEQL